MREFRGDDRFDRDAGLERAGALGPVPPDEAQEAIVLSHDDCRVNAGLAHHLGARVERDRTEQHARPRVADAERREILDLAHCRGRELADLRFGVEGERGREVLRREMFACVRVERNREVVEAIG